LNYACVSEDAALAELRAPGAGAPRDLVGVWPEAALLNHSCAPNTATVAMEVGVHGAHDARRSGPAARKPPRGPTNPPPPPRPRAPARQGRLLVRAARPVAKQAELTTSYLSGPLLLAPLAARQAALLGARGFKCRWAGAAGPGASCPLRHALPCLPRPTPRCPWHTHPWPLLNAQPLVPAAAGARAARTRRGRTPTCSSSWLT
jgi:hypothetical protein